MPHASASPPHEHDPRHWSTSGESALHPATARALTEARLQLHHAAQLVAAAGASYLPAQHDDSHTSLGWNRALGALVSQPIPQGVGFHLGLATVAFALIVTDTDMKVLQRFPLDGQTLASATEWVRTQIGALGADPARYSPSHSYSIPAHAVADGTPFSDGKSAALLELSHWFDDSAALLDALASSTPGAAPVRCWPHHFDIATRIDASVGHAAAAGTTIGVGMTPGDQYYDEPYFYVNVNPRPSRVGAPMPLAGGGSWHTTDWMGAVLPGSHIVANPEDQELQARVFLKSAIAACRLLIQ